MTSNLLRSEAEDGPSLSVSDPVSRSPRRSSGILSSSSSSCLVLHLLHLTLPATGKEQQLLYNMHHVQFVYILTTLLPDHHKNDC